MRQPDWTVHEGSRIGKFPKTAWPLALLIRNLSRRNWIEYHHYSDGMVTTSNDYHHSDGIVTAHNDGFKSDPRFRKAYSRAVSASGWDYEIPYRIHQALWCSRQAQKINGAFVELGTGRGFVMSAVLADFLNWDSGARTLHLFDTFENTPSSLSKYYANSFEEVIENFSEWPRVCLHKGNVFDTLPSLEEQEIAFLHIDMNCSEPEVYGLRFLWNRIPRGGVILLDDYAYRNRQQQYEAMNGLGEEMGFSILSTATGQGIIIK